MREEDLERRAAGFGGEESVQVDMFGIEIPRRRSVDDGEVRRGEVEEKPRVVTIEAKRPVDFDLSALLC